ncbi:MAG: flagellum-specific ATP synthase FliI, partial [Roseateles sp.]
MTSPRVERWRRYLADLETLAGNAAPLESQGKLVRVAGLVLEATGIKVPLGSVCRIQMPSSGNAPRRGLAPVNAEVVGFSGDRAY